MRRLVVMVAAIAVLTTACGSDDATEETTEAPATTEPAETTEPPATTTEAAGPSVTVAESSLGSILLDGEGNSL